MIIISVQCVIEEVGLSRTSIIQCDPLAYVMPNVRLWPARWVVHGW